MKKQTQPDSLSPKNYKKSEKNKKAQKQPQQQEITTTQTMTKYHPEIPQNCPYQKTEIKDQPCSANLKNFFPTA